MPSGRLPAPQSSPQRRKALPLAPVKKTRRGLWITLAVIAVLLLAGLGFGAYTYVIRSTPEKTLQTYCDALKRGDYQTAYNQLENGLHRLLTEQVFAAHLRLTLDPLKGIRDCAVSNVSEGIPKSGLLSGYLIATGMITFTYGNGRTDSERGWRLIDEDGVWKIY